MIRTSLYFGLWTMVCMVGAIGGFFLISDLIDPYEPVKAVLSPDNPSWRAAGFLAMFSPVAAIVATLLWALFHRGGRRTGWLGYALIALLVVLISHVLVFGVMFSIGSDEPLRSFLGSLTVFLVHGWLSVPVAFVGIALFVRWNRRHSTA